MLLLICYFNIRMTVREWFRNLRKSKKLEKLKLLVYLENFGKHENFLEIFTKFCIEFLSFNENLEKHLPNAAYGCDRNPSVVELMLLHQLFHRGRGRNVPLSHAGYNHAT